MFYGTTKSERKFHCTWRKKSRIFIHGWSFADVQTKHLVPFELNLFRHWQPKQDYNWEKSFVQNKDLLCTLGCYIQHNFLKSLFLSNFGSWCLHTPKITFTAHTLLSNGDLRNRMQPFRSIFIFWLVIMECMNISLHPAVWSAWNINHMFWNRPWSFWHVIISIILPLWNM